MSEKHCHQIPHEHCPAHATPCDSRTLLTIRSYTGLSGDMLCCGLGAIWLAGQNLEPASQAGNEALNGIAAKIMPDLAGSSAIERKLVNGIGGYHLRVDLPHAHEHRTPGDINQIIGQSDMTDSAREIARQCVNLLARCEAAVHGKNVDEIHFHEVGALDSILDICLVCELYAQLGEPHIISSPLPLADGSITCAHGVLPAPAPAVLALLPGMRVRPFALENAGELVTPTAIALLHALGAVFGPWPEIGVERTALVYGSREFAGVPNGVVFVLGKS